MQTEIEACLNVLKQGGIIAYPTDTVWGLGCDATNAKAVEKLYALKQRSDTKSFVCLVSSIAMLDTYVLNVPQIAYTIVDIADTPTTIVYDNPINLATNLIASNNTIAIRVTKDLFCKALIDKLKKPIVSTSANYSGDKTPKSFHEITQDLLKGVDHTINLHRERVSAKTSSIIKITADSRVEIIRK